MNPTMEELTFIKHHNTPEKVQQWLNTVEYDYDERSDHTIRSFRRVLRDNLAHCFEGAMATATILQTHGYRPLLLCMEARDVDHIIFVYKEGDKWGAVAQSRDQNLKGRTPRFRNLRDLVMSYYPYYWNVRTNDETDLTLRGYATTDLSKVDGDWSYAEGDLVFVEDILYDLTYRALFPTPGRKFFQSTRDEIVIWKK